MIPLYVVTTPPPLTWIAYAISVLILLALAAIGLMKTATHAVCWALGVVTGALTLLIAQLVFAA